MTTINIYTENIFKGWDVNEKDVIHKTKKLLEYYILKLKDKTCLANREYSSITQDIFCCD